MEKKLIVNKESYTSKYDNLNLENIGIKNIEDYLFLKQEML